MEFNKKKFPGIGSLSPQNKKDKKLSEPPFPKNTEMAVDWAKLENPCNEIQLGKHEVIKLGLQPEDTVGLTVSPIKNKKPPPKKNKKKNTEKLQDVFQWQIQSKKEVAGVKATYTVLLKSDGSLTCNCPGWIFKKKGQHIRQCKHTDAVEKEAAGLYMKHKKGEFLGPVLVDVITTSTAPSASPIVAPAKYGRVIEFD